MSLILPWRLPHRSFQFIALSMHICSLWNYLHNPSSLDYQVIYSLSTQSQSTMGDSIDVQVGFVQFS